MNILGSGRQHALLAGQSSVYIAPCDMMLCLHLGAYIASLSKLLDRPAVKLMSERRCLRPGGIADCTTSSIFIPGHVGKTEGSSEYSEAHMNRRMGGRGRRALVACSKPVKGVDVVDELLDGVEDACPHAGTQEEAEQESVDCKEGLPAIGAQRPADHSTDDAILNKALLKAQMSEALRDPACSRLAECPDRCQPPTFLSVLKAACEGMLSKGTHTRKSHTNTLRSSRSRHIDT